MDASIIRTCSGGPMVYAIEGFHWISNILAAIQWSTSVAFWWQLLDTGRNILEFGLCFAKEPIMSSPITFKINVCCLMYVWLMYVCVWIVYVTSVCAVHMLAFYLHTNHHWTQWFHVLWMCCVHVLCARLHVHVPYTFWVKSAAVHYHCNNRSSYTQSCVHMHTRTITEPHLPD